MKRRDSIKTLLVTSLASGLVLEGCLPKEKEIIYEKVWKYQYGRTPEEKKRDLELLNKTFFTKDEIQKIKTLANLILPPSPRRWAKPLCQGTPFAWQDLQPAKSRGGRASLLIMLTVLTLNRLRN